MRTRVLAFFFTLVMGVFSLAAQGQQFTLEEFSSFNLNNPSASTQEITNWALTESMWAKNFTKDSPTYKAVHAAVSEEKAGNPIFYPDDVRNGFVFQHGKNLQYPKGFIKKCPVADYQQGHCEWTVVVDFASAMPPSVVEGSEDWVVRRAYFSPNGRRAFVLLSLTGNDEKVLLEFDLTSGKYISPEKGGFFLSGGVFSCAWATDDTLACGYEPGLKGAQRPKNIILWQRGEKPDNAEIVFTGRDETLQVYPRRLRQVGQKYGATIFIGDVLSTDRETGHILTVGAGGRGDWKLTGLPFPAGVVGDNVEVFAGGILLNLNANHDSWKAGDLLFFSLKTGESELVFRPRQYEGFHPIGVFVVNERTVLLHTLEDAASRLQKVSLEPGRIWRVEPFFLKKDGKIVEKLTQPAGMWVWNLGDGENVIINFESFTHNTVLYTVDGATGEIVGIADYRPSPEFFNQEEYETLTFTAMNGGVSIPYYVTGKKEVLAAGHAACVKFGVYNGHNRPQQIGFYASTVYTLLRDCLYVQSMARGGGERGRAWSQAGQGANKPNTLKDVEAVVHHLVNSGLAAGYSGIALSGGSHGAWVALTVALKLAEQGFQVVVDASAGIYDLTAITKSAEGSANANLPRFWGDEFGTKNLIAISPLHILQNLECDKPVPVILLSVNMDETRVLAGDTLAVYHLATTRCGGKYADNVFLLAYPTGGHSAGSDPAQVAARISIESAFIIVRTIGEFND